MQRHNSRINIKNNNNNTAKERNKKMEKHGCSDFRFAGPCTISHHQYFKMVDLLIESHTRTMKGLNPHTLPYVPMRNNNIEIEEKKKKLHRRMINKNLKEFINF